MDADCHGILVDGYLAIDRIGNVVLTYIFYQFESRSPQPANTFYVRAVGEAQRVLKLAHSGSASTGLHLMSWYWYRMQEPISS
jgi:hypothetical protein